MKLIVQISILLTFFLTTAAHAIIVTHQCTLNEVKNNSGPCACPIEVLTPPFCPRLEGIKLPCIVKIKIGKCDYENGYVPPADPPACLVAKSCDITSIGACKAPEEAYNCDYESNGACLTYNPDYDCSTTEQGACNNMDEAGVCHGYATIVIPKTCSGGCATYEKITLPRTCYRCTAGYADIINHYENDLARCGCETFAPAAP